MRRGPLQPCRPGAEDGATWPHEVVLLLATSSQVGGTERSALELHGALVRAGVRVAVLCRQTGNGPLTDLARRAGVVLVPWSPRRPPLRLLRRADVLVTHGLRWSMTARMWRACRVVPKSTVLVSAQRGLDVWRTPVINAADRWTAGLVDLFLANSHAAAHMLTSVVGIRGGRVGLLHSGLSPEWFEGGVAPATDGPIRIMVAGSARIEKRHDLVVDVLRRLPPTGWVATIYTSGGASTAKEVLEAGLGDAVVVVHDHPLAPEDFDRHDVLLHLSDAESLPRAVLEALARGLLVVATDVGDTARAMADTGWCVPPGDPAACAAALQQALAEARLPGGRDHRSARLKSSGWTSDVTAMELLRHVRGARSTNRPSWEKEGPGHIGASCDEGGRPACAVSLDT